MLLALSEQSILTANIPLAHKRFLQQRLGQSSEPA